MWILAKIEFLPFVRFVAGHLPGARDNPVFCPCFRFVRLENYDSSVLCPGGLSPWMPGVGEKSYLCNAYLN